MARLDSGGRFDSGLRFDSPEVPVFPTAKQKRRSMSILKLELRKKDVNERLGLGTAHITKMTGNANYPDATRVPTDAQFAALQAALQDAEDARAATAATLKEQELLVDDASAAWDVGYTARGTN